MGVRFACHQCDKRLNVKRELAGKRGVCPECSTRFRIPHEDAEKSTPIVGVETKVGGVDVPLDQPVNDPVNEHVNAIADPPSPPSDSVTQTLAAKPQPAIDLLASDPTSTWYVRPPTGGQYGPASPEVLRSWIDEGRVAATSLLWRDGWPQWRVASDALPELVKPITQPDPELGRPSKQLSHNAHDPLNAGHPVSAVGDSSVPLEGRSDVGVLRRARSGRRILMIGVLLTIAITLIVALVIILKRG